MNKFGFVLSLLFLILFTTGCDVVYNLEIMGDNHKEYVVVSVDDEISDNYPIEAFYGEVGNMENPDVYAEGVDYYDDEVDLKNKIVNFSYNFSRNNFSRSNIVNNCYKNFTILKDNETNNIILSTDRNFLCFNEFKKLDNVSVRIKTNHEVISSNADSVEDDVYIWNINKANEEDAAISMVLSGEVKAKEVSFWEKNLLFIIAIGVFILGGIIYLIMKKRSEKVDKI